MLSRSCLRGGRTSLTKILPSLLNSRSKFVVARSKGPNIKPTSEDLYPVRCQKPKIIALSDTPNGENQILKKIPFKCYGCGIKLQSSDPNRPGFFKIPKKYTMTQEDAGSNKAKYPKYSSNEENAESVFEDARGLDFELENWKKESESKNIETEEVIAELRAQQLIQDIARDPDEKYMYLLDDELSNKTDTNVENLESLPVICERCYNLKNYGKIKNKTSEALNPTFNVDMLLEQQIHSRKGKKVVVLCVADLFDFDASLPKLAMRSLYPRGPHAHDMDLIFVANKLDLIPKTLSKSSLEIWIRTQLKRYGFRSPKYVHIVSCNSSFGVKFVLSSISREMMINCDCYVIGVQNSGKSSLLNALLKASNSEKKYELTAALMPGTTLGLVEVPGFPVPRNCKIFDTPGLEQVHQISKKLTFEELQLVQPKRTLKPRTYRYATGYTVLIAGLARIDLLKCPGDSLYVTVWASDELPCHMGKTEGVEEKLVSMRGVTLRPPLSNDPKLASMGELIPEEVTIEGDSWQKSTTDITIAVWNVVGLGWVAIGCKGEAKFRVWTLKDIEVSTRPSLLKEYAKEFQKPGFSATVLSRGIAK